MVKLWFLKLYKPLLMFFILGGYFFTFLINPTTQNYKGTSCTFKNVTSIPCPGCGMGRASNMILHGFFLDGLSFHFMAFPFMIASLIFVFILGADWIKGTTNFEKLLSIINRKIISYPLLINVLISWIRNIYICR